MSTPLPGRLAAVRAATLAELAEAAGVPISDVRLALRAPGRAASWQSRIAGRVEPPL